MTPINATRAGRLARHRVSKRLAAAALGLSIVAGGIAALPASADTPANLTGIILGVGADETQRIVTWYSSADTAQVVQVAPTSQIVDGVFPANAPLFGATGTANIATSGGFNRHATISGLTENTAYSYRVGTEGSWSPAYSFKTQSFEGDYDFLFFGDPQIGSSGKLAEDQAGWEDTLNVALAAHPNAELLVSGGDQVETANTESQWTAFLAPDQLRQVPWVATIGNHDVGGKAYEQHLFTPNTDRSTAYYDSSPTTKSGGDYWFIHKDVLYIDINSNAYNKNAAGLDADAAHAAYITDVVNNHGSEAKWKVVIFHHSIYSPASHAADSDNVKRREDLPTTLSNVGIDLVLQGHDHAYARTYLIKNGEKANADEQPGAADVVAGPGGVLYVTANSASGSKYYALTAPKASGTNGKDPLNPSNYWYASVENQENLRSYVKVEVRDDALTVKNIRSGACVAPNAGGGSACKVGGPVGSLVDSVTVHPFHGNGQDVQVRVPTAAPGEFGWAINGYNGLVNLGNAAESGDDFVASGSINPILVSDSRRSKAPWAVSAQVGDFTDGAKSFSGSRLGWTPQVFLSGAGAVAGPIVAPGAAGGLATSSILGSAAAGHDRGVAELGAYLNLQVPIDDALSGSYRAKLTITALS